MDLTKLDQTKEFERIIEEATNRAVIDLLFFYGVSIDPAIIRPHVCAAMQATTEVIHAVVTARVLNPTTEGGE
jgi:hypothetical protein